ncbi:hypothetical protein Fmac_017390 [Flemingia macrophylla]|uniref:Protein kinase domain-containing protein n=1 Tax=Flemingia macrophylla TaxID=520843 RepID=A0ABD1M1Z2_9FABA
MLLRCTGFCFCLKHTSSSQRPHPTVIHELCHQFSLHDLRNATNNFHQKRLVRYNKLAKVYKGCLQHNDVSEYTVAIKRFNAENNEGHDQFKNETELLCQLHHPNIISLKGFCDQKDEKIIVYEYMSNGSLDERLQSGELSWKKRLEICIGVARGLHYLHAGAKRTIIHRDVCLRSILLDDNMEPKLTGFGFSILGARFMSKPKVIPVDDHVRGTCGYMPTEYFRDSNVTDKCDVFSFGMILLQIVWGTDYFQMSEREEFMEKPIEENIDPNIRGRIAPECWLVFIDIILRCVKYEADERPTMGEVEVELEHALTLQEQADITNIDCKYTLLSKFIINLKRNRILAHDLSWMGKKLFDMPAVREEFMEKPIQDDIDLNIKS